MIFKLKRFQDVEISQNGCVIIRQGNERIYLDKSELDTFIAHILAMKNHEKNVAIPND
jgi:hypothetical protein